MGARLAAGQVVREVDGGSDAIVLPCQDGPPRFSRRVLQALARGSTLTREEYVRAEAAADGGK